MAGGSPAGLFVLLRRQFKHYPTALALPSAGKVATEVGSPVEVTVDIPNQCRSGQPTILACEAVQHCQFAHRAQLEHYAAAAVESTLTPVAGGTIKISLEISDYPSKREAAVGPTREAIRRGLSAGVAQLEYLSIRMSPTG